MMTGATLSQVYGSSPAEYQYTEINDYDGYPDSVADYLAECHEQTEICPDDEVPIIRSRNGAMVLRTLVDEGEYVYALLWEDDVIIIEPPR